MSLQQVPRVSRPLLEFPRFLHDHYWPPLGILPSSLGYTLLRCSSGSYPSIVFLIFFSILRRLDTLVNLPRSLRTPLITGDQTTSFRGLLLIAPPVVSPGPSPPGSPVLFLVLSLLSVGIMSFAEIAGFGLTTGLSDDEGRLPPPLPSRPLGQ